MIQTFYPGIVEDRNDPMQLGRVRVRVFGVHSESLDDVPVNTLPWAITLMPATSASISGIGSSSSGYIEGTMVFVFFLDGESKQQPVIIGSAPGLPQTKSIFGPNGLLEIETFSDATFGTSVDNTTISPEAALTPVPKDPNDIPPISEEKPIENPPSTASTLDISRAVAARGSNVTIVYNTLLDFGIKDDFAAIAILSNIDKECRFELKRESLFYTTVSGIRNTFKTKSRNINDTELTEKYVSVKKSGNIAEIDKSEALANFAYSNLYGNGDEKSGDGYKYRGGGFIQLTFKSNYADIGKRIGIDLVSNPDLVFSNPSIGAKCAIQYFINKYGSANKIVFSSLEEALQDITRKVNPGGFDKDYPKVKQFSLYFDTNRTPEQIENAKNKAETISPNDPNNEADKTLTQAQVDSKPIKGGTATYTSNLGFKDPHNKYPLTSLLKEQDINRLARGSSNGTLLENKLKNRRSDIKGSENTTFSEPAPAFNAKYPYNHIYSSESGHAMEFDDTPGAERIHIYHKTGTFMEIDSFGNQVNKIIGDSFTIIERNGYVYIDGTARVTVNSDVKLVIAGNLDVSVDGNMTYDVGGNIIFKAGSGINAKSGTGISLRSDGNVDIDGEKLMLNSGTSKQADVSARSGTSNDYPILSQPAFIDKGIIEIDDADESVVEAHTQKQIETGTVTKKQIENGKTMAEKPEKTNETTSESTAAAINPSCSLFINETSIPDSLQLSPNFTLGMLSSNAFFRHKIVAQHNLSVGAIACYLKGVAINCLEPIKAQYPKMFITCGFRPGSSSSQHELGQAIDMQFKVDNSEYYAIAEWIKANVLFDQLLLEYKTTGTGAAWIHISYKDSPRKQIFTYMNSKNAGSGLRKLQ